MKKLLLLTLLFFVSLVGYTSAAVGPECEINNHIRISDGNSAAFNPARDKLAFDRYDRKYKLDAAGNRVLDKATTNEQIYKSNLDGTSKVCLTCTKVVGGPPVNTHKWGPSWHKSGNFIAVQVERQTHILSSIRNTALGRYLSMNGVSSDLWVTNNTGTKWWKIFVPAAEPPSTATGVMMPTFSPDGTKITWSRLVAAASSTDPWGKYKVEVADFVVTNGVPSVKNIQDVTPEGSKLTEVGGFNADNTKLIMSSDKDNQVGTDPLEQLEIYEVDIATKEARRLTTNTWHDEHPTYTPDLKSVVYLSKNEFYLQRLDSSVGQQLSYFNDWSKSTWRSAESEWPTIPTTTEWSPDGTKLGATVQSIWLYPDTDLEIVTFNGACGKTS